MRSRSTAPYLTRWRVHPLLLDRFDEPPFGVSINEARCEQPSRTSLISVRLLRAIVNEALARRWRYRYWSAATNDGEPDSYGQRGWAVSLHRQREGPLGDVGMYDAFVGEEIVNASPDDSGSRRRPWRHRSGARMGERGPRHQPRRAAGPRRRTRHLLAPLASRGPATLASDVGTRVALTDTRTFGVLVFNYSRAALPPMRRAGHWHARCSTIDVLACIPLFQRIVLCNFCGCLIA
jgi:hypothetical protein